MNINNAPFEYPGVVIESYGTLCLVQEQKASYEGRFNTYGIYNVRQNSKGEESLSDLMIDYSENNDAFPVYAAPESQVREKFKFLISQRQEQEAAQCLKDAGLSLIKAEKDKREKVKAENLEFVSIKLKEVNITLSETVKDRMAKDLFNNKELRALITDIAILEKIKNLLQ